MASLLEVRDLHVCYRGPAAARPALAGVSFDLDAGEILGIVGESGSGKSTLAASLLRLLPANALIEKGQILLNETDILALDDQKLRQLRGKQVSLIAQEASLALHPTMRIADQVCEVLRAHEDLKEAARRQRALEILRHVFPVDAEQLASRYPHQLSGGQRQRVLIAQGIACRPLLLVADEPTASLDPSTQQEMLALFRRLREELGLAIIFITHNPALLADFADRVLVLYGARVVESGPAQAVLLAARHPYTRALLRCIPPGGLEEASGKGPLPVIPGVAPDLVRFEKGCVFEPRCADRVELCQTREPASVVLGQRHEAACLKLQDLAD